VGRAARRCGGGLDPVHGGHPDIHHHNVGPQSLRQPNRLLTFACFTHDGQVGFIVEIPAHGSRNRASTGVVILGGLFTSTLLNLFVTPAPYLRLGRSRRAPATASATPTGTVSRAAAHGD
jgi:hypothetical protein